MKSAPDIASFNHNVAFADGVAEHSERDMGNILDPGPPPVLELSEQEYREKTHYQLQEMYRQSNLVIRGSNKPHLKMDAKSIRALGPATHLRVIEGYFIISPSCCPVINNGPHSRSMSPERG